MTCDNPCRQVDRGRRVALSALGCMLLVAAWIATPTVPRPARASPPATAPYTAQLTAQAFFAAILRGQLDVLLALCDTRVSFDGHSVEGEAAIREQLEQLTTRARDRLLGLRELRVLNFREMTALYGPPPARLRSAIKPSDLFALGRFSRGGAVVVLAKRGHLWRVTALTD